MIIQAQDIKQDIGLVVSGKIMSLDLLKEKFGHSVSTIKKDNPGARKSFRARHNCDNPGPRHKARYWSCKKW